MPFDNKETKAAKQKLQIGPLCKRCNERKDTMTTCCLAAFISQKKLETDGISFEGQRDILKLLCSRPAHLASLG